MGQFQTPEERKRAATYTKRLRIKHNGGERRVMAIRWRGLGRLFSNTASSNKRE